MAQVVSSSSPMATSSRTLAGRDIQTLLLASLGGALEFYDFVVFVFFALHRRRLAGPEAEAMDRRVVARLRR